MNAEQFAGRLEKAKRTGQGRWLACCPAHPDKSPSLSIAEGDDGRVLIHCFAGCGIADIVGAAGVRLSEIMPEKPLGERMRPIRRPFPAADVLEALRTESMIVWLSGCRMAKGESLSAEDKERLDLAASRIEAAVHV